MQVHRGNNLFLILMEALGEGSFQHYCLHAMSLGT